MKISSVRFGGLGTRVAARTFALFCLCAIVPIVVSAIVADRIVRTKLRDDAATRLVSTSKSYGLLVFERLRQTDEALSGIGDARARRQAATGGHPLVPLIAFRSRRRRRRRGDIRGRPSRAPDHAVVAWHDRSGSPWSRSAGPAGCRITAALDSSYLWNPDAVYLESMRICVHGPSAEPLQCVGEEGIAQADDSRPIAGGGVVAVPRSALWRRQLVGADRATGIGCAQRTRLLRAHAADRHAHRHRHRLPVEYRADPSQPSTARAADRRGRAHGAPGRARHVAIDSKDEYGNLAQAFNRMTGSLARQFELFRTLAQIDRMILDDPSTDILVEKILPALPSLLRAPVVAVAVAARDARAGHDLVVVVRGDCREAPGNRRVDPRCADRQGRPSQRRR